MAKTQIGAKIHGNARMFRATGDKSQVYERLEMNALFLAPDGKVACEKCGKFVRLRKSDGRISAHNSRRGISCPGAAAALGYGKYSDDAPKLRPAIALTGLPSQAKRATTTVRVDDVRLAIRTMLRHYSIEEILDELAVAENNAPIEASA